jgi:hypothetical protein
VRAARPATLTTRAAAAFPLAPGRWLGAPAPRDAAPAADPADAAAPPRYGVELPAEDWNPLGLPLQPTVMAASASGGGPGAAPGAGAALNDFLSGNLPGRLGVLLALIVLSRVGVYVRLPGVDVDRFAEAMSGSGLLGYIDTLSGGSISKVGVFSLGIVPYINASILFQLLSTAFPSLKKLQREEGPQGRARFMQYQKLAALGFAVVQAVGQLTYIKPYVAGWDGEWLFTGTLALTAGSMILVHLADTITELKLGNGTSVLIFANIASSLPTSVGAAFAAAASSQEANLAIYGLAFFLTTLGIVYVQDAERQIPMSYASRYRAGALARSAYLPFKVNATGVMPVIFSSSLLALPSAAARYVPGLERAAVALAPGGPLYLPVRGFCGLFFFARAPLPATAAVPLSPSPAPAALMLRSPPPPPCAPRPADQRGADRGLQLPLHLPPARPQGALRPAQAPGRLHPGGAPRPQHRRLHHQDPGPHVGAGVGVPGRAGGGAGAGGGGHGAAGLPRVRGHLGAHPGGGGHRHGAQVQGGGGDAAVRRRGQAVRRHEAVRRRRRRRPAAGLSALAAPAGAVPWHAR